MDLMVILLWFIAFSVIVLFLGALSYFLAGSNTCTTISKKESQCDSANQQQPQSNRRKHARHANKKRHKAAAAAVTVTDDNLNSKSDDEDKQEKKTKVSEDKVKVEEQESLKASSTAEEEDQDEEFEDPMTIEEVSNGLAKTTIQDRNESNSTSKKRNKEKSTETNNASSNTISNTKNCSCSSPRSSKQDSIVLSKPKANVAPVKHTIPLQNSATNESTQTQQINNSKSIPNRSSSYDIPPHSGSNFAPSKHSQQRQETEPCINQKFRKRKVTTPTRKSPTKHESTTRQSDISTSKTKLSNNIRHDLRLQTYPQDAFNSNGYSSESDILSESPSTRNSTNNNQSSVLSTSAESKCSSKEDNIRHSLPASNTLLNKLISIFDNVSLSSEELEIILKKLVSKQMAHRQDWQSLLSTKTKNEKAIERLLEEKYQSQSKILSIELQIEKSRVLELTRTNVEMNNTIKQLQQTSDNMAPYQQTLLSYQMQLKRLTDENAHLVHQLHAYSMMPNTITELRQQQQLLDEQIRQISLRNSSLEKEISDGERAIKHAAEIYKKADTQKQERIDQMVDDLNKYKKIDKDLSTLRQKHKELRENLNKKLNEVTHERDDLGKNCDELKSKIQEYRSLKVKSEDLADNQAQESNIDQLQEELNQLKTKNDLLQQRHNKIQEELNKRSHPKEPSQTDQ